jgi:hypothetical protein
MTGHHDSDFKVDCKTVACGQATGRISISGGRGEFYLIKRQEIAVSRFHNGIAMRDRVIQCPRLAKLIIAEPL